MRLVSRLMTLASLLALCVVPSAHAAPTPASVPAAGLSPYKLRQVRMMAEEPMHERREVRERLRELRKLARQLRSSGRSTLHAGGERSRRELLPDGPLGGAPAGASARLATPYSVRAIAANLPNVRCNDTSGDLVVGGLGEGQCETAIARWNNYMVAAWNDGKGFDDGSNNSMGWGTSIDGGVTWIDHGTFALPAAYSTNWWWTSDPVLAVNPNTGAFYFSGMGEVNGVVSSLGILKGRFTGSSFAWDAPTLPRVVNWSTNFLDKQWIAVDPADGRVYLTYTDFTSAGSTIAFQWADSALTTWSTFQKLSTTQENGLVQGSRPVVGPGGQVFVAYYLIGTVDTDYYRVCRSSNRGAAFSAPNNGPSFYPNPGTGAPGFNRPQGIQFPSIAVDRSGGAHDGRLYLAWTESINWYDDSGNLGLAGNRNEIESNDTPGSATPALVGETISGSSSGSSDFDYYSIPLVAGQSIIAAVTSLTSGQSANIRMFARDGVTRLAYFQETSGDLVSYGALPLLFTAPSTGTYYLRMLCTGATGAYQVRTALATRTTERGRDQRDLFTAFSDDGGLNWSTPLRVNQDAVGFDAWLPEISVALDGQVACAWYDWRDATTATCGGESSVYLATSDDGGASWTEKGAITDTRTAWTSVSTNIIPNQGDYISMFQSYEGLAVAWADGRGGTPDAYMEWLASDRPVSTRARAIAGHVDLEWFMDRTPGTTAALYRQIGGSATWDSIATLTLDATKHLAYIDSSGIQVGQTIRYQLGVVTNGTERFYPYVSVLVGNPGLALAGAWPNPARQDAMIAFTLKDDSPARLTLLDLGGRKVYSLTVSGVGRHQLPLRQGSRIEPGVYFLRLEQGGQKVSRRLVVV